MAENKPKLKNHILLPDSKFSWESNYLIKNGGGISLILSNGKKIFLKVLKCVHISFKQKLYTEVQISGSFYTYMQIFRSKSLKLTSGHRLRRKKKKKKSKITAVPPAWSFWRDYRLVVGNLSIVPPLEPCCLPCCNFRFFALSLSL